LVYNSNFQPQKGAIVVIVADRKKQLKRRWLLIIGLLGLILPVVLSVGIDVVVAKDTKNQIYSSIDKIPANRVGVVLGTSKFRDKAKKIVNPYYQARIDAAVALYLAGKIDVIIVSGDNGTAYYNEPLLMKNDLIELGVPANVIYADNAGFRTLDSILRCRDIFGLTKFTVISQEFHNQRAIFLANHKSVKAIAFNAEKGDALWAELSRERLARIKMVYDLIFNTQATYYGDRIPIN
jgi:SanA protein